TARTGSCLCAPPLPCPCPPPPWDPALRPAVGTTATPPVPAHFPPCAGCSVKISCEAVSSLPEVTLLYWLGNGSFIEKLSGPAGGADEGLCCSPRREEPRGSGVVLRRDLLFSSFSARDLRTNFTCVVLSPVGLDTRELAGNWAETGLQLVTGE
uniref:Ig-like domain-containing protein n=1 Tax=Anas platyrhynchos platyrhynchos TaxID=8840 RepID=A0A493U3B6_ANAPP